jgi:hypothetical protein
MIRKTVRNYIKKCWKVKNSRENSWGHCYAYFGRKEVDEDLAALHLGFFLASWGMYRGSAFLLQRDYKFLLPAVKIILRYKELRTQSVTTENTEEFINQLLKLTKQLRGYFKQKYPDMKEIKNEEREASDTLITKIILGTLGVTPAYDQYFIAGLKTDSLNQSFGKSSIRELIGFSLENKEIITSLQDEIRQKKGIEYPVMKIIDMYFWRKGYEKSLIKLQYTQ